MPCRTTYLRRDLPLRGGEERVQADGSLESPGGSPSDPGVRDAMGDGEEWAYRQYAKTRFDSAAAKKDQAESESLLELRNYFSTGGGDGWTSKPGEA